MLVHTTDETEKQSHLHSNYHPEKCHTCNSITKDKAYVQSRRSQSQLLDHIDQIGVGIERDDLFLSRCLAGVLCVEDVVEFLELKVDWLAMLHDSFLVRTKTYGSGFGFGSPVPDGECLEEAPEDEISLGAKSIESLSLYLPNGEDDVGLPADFLIYRG